MASNDQLLKIMPMRLRLPMYLDQFIEDFTFHDIINDLNQVEPIFTDTERKRISDIEKRDEQVIQMFFFLCEKDETVVCRFNDILTTLYHWLYVETLTWNRLNEEEHSYIDAYERLGKVEPKHQDINVHRLKHVSILTLYFFQTIKNILNLINLTHYSQ